MFIYIFIYIYIYLYLFILIFLLQETKRHGVFTAIEDMQLQLLPSAYGRTSFNKAAAHLRGRTEMKCRERSPHQTPHLSPSAAAAAAAVIIIIIIASAWAARCCCCWLLVLGAAVGCW